jgi:hypothetical protein
VAAAVVAVGAVAGAEAAGGVADLAAVQATGSINRMIAIPSPRHRFIFLTRFS